MEAYINVDKFNGSFDGPINLKATLVLDGIPTSLSRTIQIIKLNSSGMILSPSASGTVDLIFSPNATNVTGGSTPATSRIMVGSGQNAIAAYNVCVPAGELIIFEVDLCLN